MTALAKLLEALKERGLASSYFDMSKILGIHESSFSRYISDPSVAFRIGTIRQFCVKLEAIDPDLAEFFLLCIAQDMVERGGRRLKRRPPELRFDKENAAVKKKRETVKSDLLADFSQSDRERFSRLLTLAQERPDIRVFLRTLLKISEG